jgi:hypothetical protein
MKANLLKSVVLVALLIGSVFGSTLSAKDVFVTNEEVKNEQVVSKTIYRLDGYLYRHVKYDFTYDESGCLSTKLVSKWNEEKESWTPDYRIDFTYNNGEVVMELAKWNAKESTYNPTTEKTIYAFNGNNEVMTCLNTKWNDSVKKWDIKSQLNNICNGSIFAISE